MKRESNCAALALNDLMNAALSYDEGRISLAPYEVQQLMEQLAFSACRKLTRGSELRLGSVSVSHSIDGTVVVNFKKRNQSMRSAGNKSIPQAS
jgi:hypothetical protein